jgi:alpha-glucoside transport system permease protein
MIAEQSRPQVTAVAAERRRFRLGSIPVHVAVIALTVIWIVPTLGLLVSSFRPFTDIVRSGWWTALVPPYHFTFDNYTTVLDSQNMGLAFVNSLTIAIPATVIPIAFAAFAAYAFAWMEFPGRNFLFLLIVGLLAIPAQVTWIPVLGLFTSLQLNGTFLGVWLAHTGYGLPFAVYLLRNFFGSLPRDLFESAEIDGASPLTVFFRLVLPLSVPALAALTIFQFLWTWNDFITALVYLGGDPLVAPLTVNIANLVNSQGQGYHLLTAAAFLSMALPLIVFFALQRYFVSGLLAGSVKG